MIDAKKREMYYDELKHVTTAKEVSWLWGVSVRHVYRLVDEGKIYGHRIYGGTLVISLGSCNDYLGTPKQEIKRIPLDDLQDMIKAG